MLYILIARCLCDTFHLHVAVPKERTGLLQTDLLHILPESDT